MKANQLYLFGEALEKLCAATGCDETDYPVIVEALTGLIIDEEQAGEILNYIIP